MCFFLKLFKEHFLNNLNLKNSDVVLEIVNIREMGFFSFFFFGRASVIHVDGVESLETVS